MPVSPDVMTVVRILDEEGFGALAGELLTEVATGRELDTDSGDVDAPPENLKAETPAGSMERLVTLDDESVRLQLYFDTDGGLGDPEVRRESIPESEQLAHAMAFLKLRLVEPMRRLAEAERLAGEIAAGMTASAVDRAESTEEVKVRPLRDAPPIRVSFSRNEAGDAPLLERDAKPGDLAEVDALAEVLGRIAALEV